jgi:hypothetical protein
MDKLLELIKDDKDLLAALEEVKASAVEEYKKNEEDVLEKVVAEKVKAAYQKGYQAGVKKNVPVEKESSEPAKPECLGKYPSDLKEVNRLKCRLCSFHKECKGPK